MKKTRIAIFVIILLSVMGLFCVNCKQNKTQKQLFNDYYNALPGLKALAGNKTYTLQVDYIQDNNLPQLTEKQLEELLQRTVYFTHKLLHYTISLKIRRKIAIDAFFAEKKADFKHPVLSYPIQAWFMDPADPDLKNKLKPVVIDAIDKKPLALLEKYFGTRTGTQSEYVESIVNRFIHKLWLIYSAQDLSGKPLYDPKITPERLYYLSYAHWDTLTFQEKDADFYLTNITIAGPDSGMPLYVINRGGISSGFVENNAFRPFQAVGIVTLYPFLAKSAFFQKERGIMSAKETIDCIALIWLHELGHFLMRKKENYTLEGSVHMAPRDLNYREWARKIKKVNNAQSNLIPVLKKF